MAHQSRLPYYYAPIENSYPGPSRYSAPESIEYFSAPYPGNRGPPPPLPHSLIDYSAQQSGDRGSLRNKDSLITFDRFVRLETRLTHSTNASIEPAFDKCTSVPMVFLDLKALRDTRFTEHLINYPGFFHAKIIFLMAVDGLLHLENSCERVDISPTTISQPSKKSLLAVKLSSKQAIELEIKYLE
jgi:hypothetical protein